MFYNGIQQTIGFNNGWRFMTNGAEIIKNDYADPPTVGVRFHSTIAGFQAYLKAFGPLADADGEDIDSAALMRALNGVNQIHRGLIGWHGDAMPQALAELRMVCRSEI